MVVNLSRAFWSSVLLAVFSISAAGWWLSQFVERPVVAIEAATDVPENGLPVYAQFVVTQTLQVPEVVSLTGIEVPIFFPPESQHHITIELLRNGHHLHQWVVASQAPGSVEYVHVMLPKPLLVDGRLEVRFQAADISHADRDQAARLFIETADANYSYGNYRIAENEKRGDVSLTLWGRQRVWTLWYEQWQDKPLLALADVAKLLLLVAVAILLPMVVGVGQDNGSRAE